MLLALGWRGPLDAGTLAWIEKPFADHPVLVIPRAGLGPRELRRFGPALASPKLHSLVDYRQPKKTDIPSCPWLTMSTRTQTSTGLVASVQPIGIPTPPYEDEPPRLAILSSKEVPSSQGGRCFADMRAAYDALSGG